MGGVGAIFCVLEELEKVLLINWSFWLLLSFLVSFFLVWADESKEVDQFVVRYEVGFAAESCKAKERRKAKGVIDRCER